MNQEQSKRRISDFNPGSFYNPTYHRAIFLRMLTKQIFWLASLEPIPVRVSSMEDKEMARCKRGR